jgi:hypothetical protein
MSTVACRACLLIGLAAATMAAGAGTAGAQGDPGAAFEHCRTIADTAARLRCYEAAAPRPQAKGAPLAAGGWRLVRTPDPRGGADAVSIMRAADISRSDVELAGLMVRCAEHGTEMLVVMVTPLPPRARPQVTLRSAGREARFEARVTPPGAALLLPPEAQALLTGPWQAEAEPELSLEVVSDAATTRGIVPLAGLRPAMAGLAASCAGR